MSKNVKLVTAAVAGWALLTFVLFQTVEMRRVFGVIDQRVVQRLNTPDSRFKAELVRRHAFLDLNFLVFVNGEKIYTSPDFDPIDTVPFRETMVWDTTGENLILEIAGRRLFGYNLTARRRLPDKTLLSLKAQNPKPEELGLQARWPGH